MFRNIRLLPGMPKFLGDLARKGRPSAIQELEYLANGYFQNAQKKNQNDNSLCLQDYWRAIEYQEQILIYHKSKQQPILIDKIEKLAQYYSVLLEYCYDHGFPLPSEKLLDIIKTYNFVLQHSQTPQTKMRQFVHLINIYEFWGDQCHNNHDAILQYLKMGIYLEQALNFCQFNPSLGEIINAIKSCTEKLSYRYTAIRNQQNSINTIMHGISLIMRLKNLPSDMYDALSNMYANLGNIFVPRSIEWLFYRAISGLLKNNSGFESLKILLENLTILSNSHYQYIHLFNALCIFINFALMKCYSPEFPDNLLKNILQTPETRDVIVQEITQARLKMADNNGPVYTTQTREAFFQPAQLQPNMQQSGHPTIALIL